MDRPYSRSGRFGEGISLNPRRDGNPGRLSRTPVTIPTRLSRLHVPSHTSVSINLHVVTSHLIPAFANSLFQISASKPAIVTDQKAIAHTVPPSCRASLLSTRLPIQRPQTDAAAKCPDAQTSLNKGCHRLSRRATVSFSLNLLHRFRHKQVCGGARAVR